MNSPPFWVPGKEIMEFVVAVFKHRIQDGCNLIGAEDICSSYETTFLRGGEIQYSLWLTDYEVTPWDLKVELALNQRLLIDHDLLKSVESGGIVIVRSEARTQLFDANQEIAALKRALHKKKTKGFR